MVRFLTLFAVFLLWLSAAGSAQALDLFEIDSGPRWQKSSSNGSCQLSRRYGDTDQRIDVHFKDQGQASVFLSYDRFLIDSQLGIDPVIEAETGYFAQFKPLVLSPRKIVFEVSDVSSFLQAISHTDQLRVVTGGKAWVYRMPSDGGLVASYNQCFPGQQVLVRPRVIERAPVSELALVPPPARAFTAKSLPMPVSTLPIRSPVVRSVPLAAVSAVDAGVRVAAEAPVADVVDSGGGFFNKIGSLFSSKDSGFERVSRLPQALDVEKKVVVPRFEPIAKVVPRPVVAMAPVALRSAVVQPRFTAPAPLQAMSNVQVFAPRAPAAPRFAPIAVSSVPRVVDVGQSCGAALPPELAPMQAYLADGSDGNSNSDRELVASLKQKMLLLEREKESLRSGQAEQPSPLSLVRVCTQEKTEIGALAERLGRLEARTFELSQQQLQEQIAKEDAALNAPDPEEFESLVSENAEMRDRLRDMRAQLNSLRVEQSNRAEEIEVAPEEAPVSEGL